MCKAAARAAILAAVSIAEGRDDGFDAVVLASPDSRLVATFLPGLNMLGSSLRHDGVELLHRRGGPADYAARGKTCGLPFLHPWANRLAGDRYRVAGRDVVLGPGVPRDANGLPIHGLLGGATPWEVVDARQDGRGTVLEARFVFEVPSLLASFPWPHEVRVRATLGDAGLDIETTVTPTTDAAVPVSFGWHPYLQLPGAPRQHWTLALPARRRLLLDARGIPTGEALGIVPCKEPLADRTLDDLFTDLASPAAFAIDDGARRVEVVFGEGYPFAQVWAPPGSPFVCLEPMTAATNALGAGGPGVRCVEPGQGFSASFSIRVTCAG